MLLVDAHLDLAWNAIDWNRDLALPVEEIRKRERGMSGVARGASTVSFAEMRRGQVGLCIATLLARALRPTTPPIQRYATMEAAYASAVGQMAYYRAMEASGAMRWIRNGVELASHVRAWNESPQSAPLGFILSMEGADPVLSPDQVHEWWEAGLRIIGPAHYGVSPYAHGTATEGGLFPLGRPLLEAMERVGMILDVTHLADQSFWEALDAFQGPVLASHHNCRALVPGDRQLADEQIKALIERGAVIGMAFDAWMMVSGWERGVTTPAAAGVTIESIVQHVDHICQMAGNARHVAIGSDLDGGFGREQCPKDLDTIADLRRLPDLLAKHGYGPADVEGIMSANWLRFFQGAWRRGASPAGPKVVRESPFQFQE
jgi:membrane dipeptidase